LSSNLRQKSVPAIMSSKQEILWEVTFTPKERFIPGSVTTGQDILERMKFLLPSKPPSGSKSISRKTAAKIAAKELWKLTKSEGVRPIKEQYVADRILKFYTDYMSLNAWNEQKRTEDWYLNHRNPFRASMFEPFIIASDGPKKKKKDEVNPGEKGDGAGQNSESVTDGEHDKEPQQDEADPDNNPDEGMEKEQDKLEDNTEERTANEEAGDRDRTTDEDEEEEESEDEDESEDEEEEEDSEERAHSVRMINDMLARHESRNGKEGDAVPRDEQDPEEENPVVGEKRKKLVDDLMADWAVDEEDSQEAAMQVGGEVGGGRGLGAIPKRAPGPGGDTGSTATYQKVQIDVEDRNSEESRLPEVDYSNMRRFGWGTLPVATLFDGVEDDSMENVVPDVAPDNGNPEVMPEPAGAHEDLVKRDKRPQEPNQKRPQRPFQQFSIALHKGLACSENIKFHLIEESRIGMKPKPLNQEVSYKTSEARKHYVYLWFDYDRIVFPAKVKVINNQNFGELFWPLGYTLERAFLDFCHSIIYVGKGEGGRAYKHKELKKMLKEDGINYSVHKFKTELKSDAAFLDESCIIRALKPSNLYQVYQTSARGPPQEWPFEKQADLGVALLWQAFAVVMLLKPDA